MLCESADYYGRVAVEFGLIVRKGLIEEFEEELTSKVRALLSLHQLIEEQSLSDPIVPCRQKISL